MAQTGCAFMNSKVCSRCGLQIHFFLSMNKSRSLAIKLQELFVAEGQIVFIF